MAWYARYIQYKWYALVLQTLVHPGSPKHASDRTEDESGREGAFDGNTRKNASTNGDGTPTGYDQGASLTPSLPLPTTAVTATLPPLLASIKLLLLLLQASPSCSHYYLVLNH